MDKIQRNERIAILSKLLIDSPCKLITLGCFSEAVGSAKSTICEDIEIIKEIFIKNDFGLLETVSGAAGGVKFIPLLSIEKIKETIRSLCDMLGSNERILPGSFIYMLDVIYNPQIISNIARIFVSKFYKSEIDYVVTVETKGIPLAYETAKYLNVPLVIVRHYNEATDGASVNINYISGSSSKLQTMVLSLKALKKNSRLLFIDDFMKGGGTAKGIIELAKEFSCSVVGTGVLIETKAPKKKLVDNYYSLLTLDGVDEVKKVVNIKVSN